MDVCGCKGCNLPVLALGMCNKHYMRNRKYGSPFSVMSHSGSMKGLSAPERFGLQVKMTEGCWLWAAAQDQDGYGVFRGVYDGIIYHRAHRYSWALHNRQNVPKAMLVCHSCDNPRCVNPDHLFLGTESDNMRDKIAKNRHNVPKGELNRAAILTEAQARAILADPRPYAQIAADYGVIASTVGSIKNRASWSHLDAEVVKNPHAQADNRRGKGTKITAENVIEIRKGEKSGAELAEQYGVSRGLICNIQKRRVWAHVQ